MFCVPKNHSVPKLESQELKARSSYVSVVPSCWNKY